jgi:hypothetical protein
LHERQHWSMDGWLNGWMDGWVVSLGWQPWGRWLVCSHVVVFYVYCVYVQIYSVFEGLWISEDHVCHTLRCLTTGSFVLTKELHQKCLTEPYTTPLQPPW